MADFALTANLADFLYVPLENRIRAEYKMTPIHIVGQPGSGKTSLIVDIIKELNKQNIKVGSIKHSAHDHELDKQGKDSYRHRKAGASPVSMITKKTAAIYLPKSAKITPQTILEKYYSDIDIVLIEGWISGPYNKIEVWRKAVKKSPLFSNISMVKAFVTDDTLDRKIIMEANKKKIRIVKRSNIELIAENILSI